jgi:hypothetical protein
MGDIYWDRLEAHTRDVQLEEGLQARIADPLFLLARQWQVGEFRGEDAASPVHVRLRVEHPRVSSFRNEASGQRPVEAIDGLLETRAEAEATDDSPSRFGLSAQAGLALLRRLDIARLSHLRSTLRTARPLPLTPEMMVGLPPREARRLRLLAHGSIDGLKLLNEGIDAFLARLPAADREKAFPVFKAWEAEQRARIARPGASGETWLPSRLEHRFSVAAPTADGDVVLRAAEYPGGHLDWYSFDVQAKATHGNTPPDKAPARTVDVLPVPVEYAGMPASRYWALEDGSVYFGGISSGPTDIGRLIVAEFATIYSDDWFLVPVRLPVGCIARVVSAQVWTVFGEQRRVTSVAQRDEADTPGRRPWAFFELTGDGSAAGGTPWLFIAPSLGTSQSGPSIEEVSFIRDEAANLAWAVEQRIESPRGSAIPRRLEWTADGAARSSGNGAAWRYRLQSAVPPHWIPFVVDRPDPASPAVRLQRARLLAWGELPDPQRAGAKGRLLATDGPLFIHEEEIPRGGIRVTRHWQMARGSDGRLYLWRARQKHSGRGERGSGLRFDTLER